jgi:hypothetical protein
MGIDKAAATAARKGCPHMLLSQLVGAISSAGWSLIDGNAVGSLGGSLAIVVRPGRPLHVQLTRGGACVVRGACVGARAVVPRLVRALRERIAAAEDALPDAVWTLAESESQARQCQWIEDTQGMLRRIETL